MVHHREEDRIGIPFPNHSSDVLCSLNEQRRDGLLCDVVLIVRDQEYRTHRSVLAACSQYFKKLFTVATGSLEDGRHHHTAIYEIDFVPPDSLTAILEFAYTSTLTVTASNVKEILNAARMLEIPCIINVCLEIMDSGGEGAGRDVDDDEEEDDEEEEEEESRNEEDEDDERSLRSPESRVEPLGTNESPAPSTSSYQETSADNMSGKQESLENRALKDFSIASLLQDGLYPRMSTLDRRANFSPLLPAFYPSMWAADFPAFPQSFLDPGLHQRPRAGASPRVPAAFPPTAAAGPLNLAVKQEIIKEEMKEEVPPGLLHSDFLKEFVSSGLCGSVGAPGSVPPPSAVKDEAELRSYLNFLNSASQLGALFPPWQLEEERKMKPKSSQQCPICNKIIQGAGKLPRHMRTHTGEKPYMCTICEVRFTRQDKLKIHMRKHTGERPYICLHCNSKFVHNYDLKNHLRIHTGVRPYQCEHCYKSFTRSDHLHRHIKRQSCRISRPRRGRKPAAWRSAGPAGNFLCPPTANVTTGGGFKAAYEEGKGRGLLGLSGEEEKEAAERQRGVFAFALAGEDVLSRSPYYAATSDPWTVRLERAPPMPESAT
ncbi:zinc finger and BTB domain-containing protein 7C [Nerophis ophidion]|uniref:zinc finger and BTB domain-containing protein 7C n=1 Tax=Nerophis ophidion TaxID=159077 RepID=UPI002ADFBD7A|nr:zinc finger and BTB domain-containing protein 7C [Nerophis ophidion]XP_061732466.1 zinc finger and BTB domain-containing protein 7C [Nerophis ophidion]XP_061732467.1 zinc finger and BTB domain-containing protein 7C [Nerophis ophidion]